MRYILLVILLALPVSAQADWSGAGMHPGLAPNLNPTQGQTIRRDVHVNVTSPARVEQQHRAQPAQPAQPIRSVSKPQDMRHDQSVRHDQPIDHRQAADRPESRIPDYFRHDVSYYGHVNVIFPYSDVDLPFIVPGGFEAVMVNGETFYYNQGVFYQQVGAQLVAIPAVPGAVVDSIPEDYQIVMADGVHYLFTGGVYYQRVDQGFEVVQPPDIQDS
jgi:hypothetical protein